MVEVEGVIRAYNLEGVRKFFESRPSKPLALYVIGSTKTSTIPKISVAGATPQATMFTPALDVEYLVYGRTISMKEIPVTPEGIPTPAVLTRAVLNVSNLPFFVVDSGSYLEPKIPKITLPSKRVGGRIDIEEALPEGTSERLFNEAKTIGRTLLRCCDVIAIGESIPGGTTTALGIMVSLGYRAWGLVSSAGPQNPLDLKRRVVTKGLERCKDLPTKDPFRANDCLGDPVHITMAGIVAGALENDLKVILAGGTQMGAVLAILKRLNFELKDKLIIGTTRWIIEDPTSDIIKIVKMIDEEVPIAAFDYNFSDSPYEGLRYYEKGFVKEGVGAGGTALLALLSGKVSRSDIIKAVYNEYGNLIRGEGPEG